LKTTPNYIKSLLMPSTQAPQGRRVWSVDLESVWLPFFTATNLMGDTAIPLDAMGAPLRLAYDKDGSVKFARNGRPVTRVAKPIAQTVSLIRENFVANLKQYASGVAESRTDDFNRQIVLQREAGEPIIAHDKAEMEKAVSLQVELAMAEAQKQAEAEAEAETTPEPERDLVTA